VLILNKFGYFCYRCAAYSTDILGVGFIIEKQMIHNSFDRLDFRWQSILFTNVPRIVIGRPVVLDNDQYWHAHII
jgi:hypothetical protein